MNFLWSDNLNNLATNYLISPAKYGGFLIRYSGTNAAAQTTTLLNMGNVILNVLNNDKVNTDVEFLSLANNLYYGSVEASSVSGGAFAFSRLPHQACAPTRPFPFQQANRCPAADRLFRRPQAPLSEHMQSRCPRWEIHRHSCLCRRGGR